MAESVREGLDLSAMAPVELERYLFDRPVAASKSARLLHSASLADDWMSDPDTSISALTRVFDAFGDIADRYSDAQIEQGLWMVRGDPCFAHVELCNPARDGAVANDFARSAYRLFADYLAHRPGDFHCSPLFSWWDDPWDSAPDQLFDAVVETMIRTLDLPHPACRRAALHGLNHVIDEPGGIDRPHPRAVPAIDAFLARHGAELSEEDRAFALRCRAGEVA